MYEEPRTPNQRLLELGELKQKQKRELEARYQALNPVKLRKRIEQLRTRLFDLLKSESEQAERPARRHGPSNQLGRKMR